MAPQRPSAGAARGGNGVFASLMRCWQRTYAADYIGFILLLAGYLVLQFTVTPFHRMFSLHDRRISFPHAEIERVPLFHDFIYALFIPLGLFIAINLAARASPHKHHVTLLGFAIAMVLASFLTDVIKNAVGRPRPDLLARCVPSAEALRESIRKLENHEPDLSNGLVTIAVCTQTHHHTLHDGWRSFPSGHTSFAFAGLGYLSLFLAGQLQIFKHAARGDVAGHAEKVVRGDLVRALACGAPLLAATMVGISRCQDYRHDVWDVCVGALLGWAVAYWSYRRYWPRLGSARCEEPYAGPPGAAAGEDGQGLYGRVRDEEEAGAGRNMH